MPVGMRQHIGLAEGDSLVCAAVGIICIRLQIPQQGLCLQA